MTEYDAVVVGAGPNGLAAAIELSRSGRRVLVVEGHDTVGGGARSEALTAPGYIHDVCSAVFALGHASPFLRTLHLQRFGLEWVQPDIPVAQALEGGAVPLHRDLEAAAAALGTDGAKYRSLMTPIIANPAKLYTTVLGPLLRIPPHPLTTARFGLRGLPSVRMLTRRFSSEGTRALFAGLAAHATTTLDKPLTGAMALVLAAAAHTDGYPFVKGGSQVLMDAMAAALTELGGRIETGMWVSSLDELPTADVYLLDLMPGAAADVAGSRVSGRRKTRLRAWEYGPATFKVDYATNAAIPWSDPLLRRTGTVHVGGTFEEVAEAERAPVEGRHTDAPFLILAQPTVVDPTRAPDGCHTVWAYAHVPAGSDRDITDLITDQIERFAPGFRKTIVAAHTSNPSDIAEYNPNNVGGVISAGRFGLWSLVARPRLSLNPYRLADGVYLCSAATPPGVGVHGMSGYHAARSVLRAHP